MNYFVIVHYFVDLADVNKYFRNLPHVPMIITGK